MNVKNKSKIAINNIILIGFMGSGKTTIGKALAKSLNMNFIDTDQMIEQQEGMTISQIFETMGESKFRQLEYKFILGLSNTENSIIATGGGMPCYNRNLTNLKQVGLVIHLKAGISTLLQRISTSDTRPLAQHDNLKTTITQLLKARRQFYKQADITIMASREEELIVNRIISLL